MTRLRALKISGLTAILIGLCFLIKDIVFIRAFNKDYVLPEAIYFDHTVGAKIQTNAETPLYVAAGNFTSDEKPDVLTLETSKLALYRNTLGTNDAKWGLLKREGFVGEVGGEIVQMIGGDMDDDKDNDLVIATNLTGDAIEKEYSGQITAILDPESVSISADEWQEDQLAASVFNPNLEQNQTFNVRGNTSSADDHKYLMYKFFDVEKNITMEKMLPPSSLKVDEGSDLTKVAKVGDWYSLKVLGLDNVGTSKLKVFLNSGEGMFSEPKCNQGISIPQKRLIYKMELGDFNQDKKVDLAVVHNAYDEGEISKLTIKIKFGEDLINVNDVEDYLKMKMLMGHYEEEGLDQPHPYQAMFIVEDEKADFTNRMGLPILPNATRRERYTIAGAEGTQLVFETTLTGKMLMMEAAVYFRTLATQGATYRIVRVDQSTTSLFKGDGTGCFENIDTITGAIYELFYGSFKLEIKDNEQQGYFTAITDLENNFGAQNSLVGRKINPAVTRDEKGETVWEEAEHLYEIVANTDHIIYVKDDLRDIAKDLINDFAPDIYVISPLNTNGVTNFVYDTELAIQNTVNTSEISTDYTSLSWLLGKNGPPYRAAFADYDGDGDDDFVYAALKLFYKENHQFKSKPGTFGQKID